MDFTWKDWKSAQRMIDLYDKHRILYYAYLLWLLFQSVVAFAILVVIVGFLIYTSIFNDEDHAFAVFTLICLISWAWGYFSSVISRIINEPGFSRTYTGR